MDFHATRSLKLVFFRFADQKLCSKKRSLKAMSGKAFKSNDPFLIESLPVPKSMQILAPGTVLLNRDESVNP